MGYTNKGHLLWTYAFKTKQMKHLMMKVKNGMKLIEKTVILPKYMFLIKAFIYNLPRYNISNFNY